MDWHYYPWPWVSLTWLLYNLQLWHHRRWFQKFTARFWPIRKEIVSSMCNNEHVCRRLNFSSKESYFCPFLQTSHLPNYHQVTFQMSFLSLWTNGRLFLLVLFTTMLYLNNSNILIHSSLSPPLLLLGLRPLFVLFIYCFFGPIINHIEIVQGTRVMFCCNRWQPLYFICKHHDSILSLFYLSLSL